MIRMERPGGGIYTWLDDNCGVSRASGDCDERRYEFCKGQLSLELISWCGNGGLHGEASNEILGILANLNDTQLGVKSGAKRRGKNPE